MDIATQFAELDRYIDERSYKNSKFVQTLVNGELDTRKLRRWAIQKYWQVFKQNRSFSGIHTNAPHEDVRRFMVDNLIAEETEIADGTDTHYNLMKRFAIALGATEQEVAETPVGEPVQQFVDYIIRTCQQNHFTLGLLANYVNERQTPASAGLLYETFKAKLGLSDAALEWFTVHSGVDVHHSTNAKTLILKYAHELPDFFERARPLVRDGAAIWQRLHDYYFSLIDGRNPS